MGTTPQLTEPTRSPRVDERMDHANASAVAGDPRYPDGTAFVPASLPRLGEVLDRHLALGRPVFLVYDYGHERLVETPELNESERAVVQARRAVAQAIGEFRRRVHDQISR